MILVIGVLGTVSQTRQTINPYFGEQRRAAIPGTPGSPKQEIKGRLRVGMSLYDQTNDVLCLKLLAFHTRAAGVERFENQSVSPLRTDRIVARPVHNLNVVAADTDTWLTVAPSAR